MSLLTQENEDWVCYIILTAVTPSSLFSSLSCKAMSAFFNKTQQTQ